MEVSVRMTNEPGIEPISLEQHKESPPEEPRALFTLRTFISAAIFGALGAVLGRWIGHLGERDEHKLGRTVFSWAGGIGGAVLAAYTSTTMARRENREEQESQHMKLAKNNAAESAPIAPATVSISPATRVDSLEYAGAMDSSTQQHRVI